MIAAWAWWIMYLGIAAIGGWCGEPVVKELGLLGAVLVGVYVGAACWVLIVLAPQGWS